MLPRLLILLILISSAAQPSWAKNMSVISSHGPYSGPLAETLPGLVLDTELGVDFLGLKLVMTADDQVIVFHSLYLEETTDVAQLFAPRQRQDGHYYIVDFTLSEIRQLRHLATTSGPTPPPALGIASFAETLALIRHLETVQQSTIGIAPEIVAPQFHRQRDKDISRRVLQTLRQYNYTTKESPVVLQCYDPDELQRIHNELLPELMLDLPLLQLIGATGLGELSFAQNGPARSYDYGWMYTRLGLRVLGSYAWALGLDTSRLTDQNGKLLHTDFMDNARALGLKIFAQSLRNSPLDLPAFAGDYQALLEYYATTVGVDGVITESPAETVAFCRTNRNNIQAATKPKPAWPLDPDLPPFSFESKTTTPPIRHAQGHRTISP